MSYLVVFACLHKVVGYTFFFFFVIQAEPYIGITLSMNGLVHECVSVHESPGVATSLVNPSLLSHSRFSAIPDGRIVLLCSAQPRSAGFEPVGRGPTLGFHIPGLGGQGLYRSGSLYLV